MEPNMKPPLSKSIRSIRIIKELSSVNSPKHAESPQGYHLPPIIKRSKNTGKTIKLDQLYEKIQSFESPKSDSTPKKSAHSFSGSVDFMNRSPYKTPSPKSSPRNEIYSDWEIKQALEAPRSRNIRNKRVSLITSLKSV